jgi:hypothetical protein
MHKNALKENKGIDGECVGLYIGASLLGGKECRAAGCLRPDKKKVDGSKKTR